MPLTMTRVLGTVCVCVFFPSLSSSLFIASVVTHDYEYIPYDDSTWFFGLRLLVSL